MKRVLVIGAGFLQDFVIKEAVKLGYYTLAVDGNPNAVGFAHANEHAVINIVDKEACLEYAKSKAIDGVLTAATDYGVLTTSYIAENLHLPGLKYNVAELIKNKYQVRRKLFEEKVDDAEQAYEVNSTTDLMMLSEKIQYPVMVKPCDGSGSRGAGRVDSKEAFSDACQAAMDSSITHRAEVESFITGHEYGAESLVVNGEVHVLAVMKKWMTEPPYYAELGHAIPSGLSSELEKRVVSIVTKAITVLGINHGSVNMDMIITDEGKVYIIDIGARMGGNMIGPWLIPCGSGIEYISNMLKVCVGDAPDFTAGEKTSVATKLLAFGGGVVSDLSCIEKYETDENVSIVHHMNIGDVVNEYHTNLDGCGYILVKDSDVVIAEQKAAQILREIESSVLG